MPEPKPSPVIRLRGVRHNNLKHFDLDLPLHRLIVVTGLSGSGKSSLAFDTLYAEGQRRYIETFSPYARQFFDRMDKPQVDSIEGIPPAIAIEQRNAVRSTRSTVGTITEICDHMKVLWPHLAQLHCRGCGQPVRKDSPQSIGESLVGRASSRAEAEKPGSSGASPHREVLITFDVPLSDKLPLAESLALISKQGYQRLLMDGVIIRLDDESVQSAIGNWQSAITVIQDRVRLAPAARARFVEACEQAYHFGKGKLTVWEIHPPVSIRQPRFFSNRLHCAQCDIEYPDPSPALFSFNHPLGACPTCKGFGRTITIDYDLAIPDRSLTLTQGAVRPWRTGFSADCQRDLTKFCKARHVPMNVPFNQLSAEHQEWIIQGEKDYGIDEEHEWPRAWYGVKGYFRWLETKSYKMHVRVLLSRYRAYAKCAECQGARLKPDALLYLLRMEDRGSKIVESERKESPSSIVHPPSSLSLPDFYALPVRDALAQIDSIAKSRITHHASRNDPISHALSEIRTRLAYLDEVGLGYLTLDRPTRTLSGGETERVNLTTCLGTRLVNTLFVLDEPSVGLHPRDTDRLVRILEKLRDTGNTVIVVEHEASVMRAADQIVDIGPGHGATGGEVVFQGPLPELLKSNRSLTGQYLSGKKQIEIPSRRPIYAVAANVSSRQTDRNISRVLTNAATLRITNATRHNLQNLTVEIPLNRLVAVTGVSGSGKSTLVRDILLPALQSKLQSAIANRQSPIPKASDRLDSNEPSSSSDDEDSALRIPHSASITGHESLSQVVLVDQSALGKTPRSNPAVYIGAFDDIREVFAQSEPAQQRGLNASAFSFNSAVGQCERCRGAGFEKIEMQFLSDIFIRCPDCNGRRYRQHILEVKVQSPKSNVQSRNAARTKRTLDLKPQTLDLSWSIGDLLEATVDEAIDFLSGFTDSKPARRAGASLKLLQEVGLGYLRLGQPINTLSGGESQRLKLVRHLAEASLECDDLSSPSAGDLSPSNVLTLPLPTKPVLPAFLRTAERGAVLLTSQQNSKSGDKSPHSKGAPNRRTLFLFDEPTTGLHFDDVRVLLKVFQRLVDAGHSVIVIEHNLDVIKCADWVIDLGPEAGDGGGQIVAQGTPEDIAACAGSHTGVALKSVVK